MELNRNRQNRVTQAEPGRGDGAWVKRFCGETEKRRKTRKKSRKGCKRMKGDEPFAAAGTGPAL